MQKTTLLVFLALLAVAAATISKEGDKSSASKSNEVEFKFPYLSRKFSSRNFAFESSPISISKRTPTITQTNSPVLKTEEPIQASTTNVDVQRNQIKQASSLSVEIPQCATPKENSPVFKGPKESPVSKSPKESSVSNSEVVTQVYVENVNVQENQIKQASSLTVEMPQRATPKEKSPVSKSPKKSPVSKSPKKSPVSRKEVTQVYVANTDVQKNQIELTSSLSVEIPQYEMPKQKSPVSKSPNNSPVSKSFKESSVSKQEELTQVHVENHVDVQKHHIKLTHPLTVEIPEYDMAKEKSPVSSPVPKKETIVQTTTTNIKETITSITKTQVLTLKVTEKIDEHLVFEWKNGKNLDWTFYSLDDDVENVVKAHKSVVLKYSSYLADICQLYADRGAPKNSFPFYYPAKIIQSILTLLYEHSVTINSSDYDLFIDGCKALQIDHLIEIL